VRSPDATSRLGWLLLPTTLLFAAWSFIVPIFEAPDEPSHWQYARHLHDHRSLPTYAKGFEEANSPPLYYATIAPLARETNSPSMVIAVDPKGQLASLAPPRTFLNTDADFSRYWPIRAGRLVSVLMSVGTVWITFLAGRSATGLATTGLLAAIVIALLPQFAFRGSQVSNDALVTLLGSAVTLGSVKLVQHGFSWPRGVWTAVALAGAYLSKISAIALIAPVAWALVVAAPPLPWRTRAARLGVLTVTLILVLPWSLRNQWLYGDPFASGAMRTAVAHIITDRSLFSSYFVWSFPIGLVKSFVGVFGWMSLVLPLWFYACFVVLGALALAGLTRTAAVNRERRPLIVMLVLTVLGVLAVVVHINLSFTQPQGRYMFPALPAVALLCALGLQSLPGPVALLARPAVLGTTLACLHLYALLGVVVPAYYPAPSRDLEAGRRQVHPALLRDIAFSPPSGELIVTGPTPAIVTPVDVDAHRFDALTLRVRARLPVIDQTACVVFATVPAVQGAPLCTAWRADGTPQTLRLDLSRYPAWHGHVTHLTVVPLQNGGATLHGTRLSVEPFLFEQRDRR
jgi:4-amino-4-deoxy-L-arabinose transferase-like glycosyltransferase